LSLRIKLHIILGFLLIGAAAGPAPAGPSLLFEPATGRVIAQDRAGMLWYPASLTKLMTAYLTFQALRGGRLKLDQEIPVSWLAARQPPIKIGLPAGSRVTVDFALQALLVYSANDIAVVLAEAVSENLQSFVVEMNKAAKRMGMTGSRFLNPNGLHDPQHFSTARDIALLAATVYAEFPEYRHYYEQDFISIGKRKLRNRNRLLVQMAEADGMKTGFVCAAGFNLVATAQIKGKRLMAVLLGASNSANRADWAQSLLTMGAIRTPRNMTVKDIINGSAAVTEPPDLTSEMCEGRRGLALKPASALKGHGVSLGRFEKREEALKVLRVWSDSGDAYMEGASMGLIRLPDTTGFTAMVWDLDEREAQSLCSFLKDRSVACELMVPERLQELAQQARSAAKSSPKKRSRKKKKG
jgi:D-alanyl-D-alanine carboxypeptidase